MGQEGLLKISELRLTFFLLLLQHYPSFFHIEGNF